MWTWKIETLEKIEHDSFPRCNDFKKVNIEFVTDYMSKCMPHNHRPVKKTDWQWD